MFDELEKCYSYKIENNIYEIPTKYDLQIVLILIFIKHFAYRFI